MYESIHFKSVLIFLFCIFKLSCLYVIVRLLLENPVSEKSIKREKRNQGHFSHFRLFATSSPFSF